MVKEFFAKNGLQLGIYLISFAGLMVGIYTAVRNDLLTLSHRVNAIEERNIRVDPLVERFIKSEVAAESMKEDISEIKTDIKDIKNYWNIK